MPWNCDIILPGLEKKPSCKSQSPGAKVIRRNVRNCTKIKNQMIPWAHWAGAELMALRGLHLRIISPDQRTLWNLYQWTRYSPPFIHFQADLVESVRQGKFGKSATGEAYMGSWRDLEVINEMGVGGKIKVSVLCVTLILDVAGNLTQQIGIWSWAVSLMIDFLILKQTTKKFLLFSQ